MGARKQDAVKKHEKNQNGGKEKDGKKNLGGEKE